MRSSTILLGNGLSLEIADDRPATGYPTARLAKGLLLSCDGHALAEEAVGFGVPTLKRGAETVFPGGMKLVVHRRKVIWRATATYQMNMVERLCRPGEEDAGRRALDVARDSLSAFHRRSPRLRGALSAGSAALRRRFGWVRAYQEVPVVATLPVTYLVRPEEGIVTVSADLRRVFRETRVKEVALMNELGAACFGRYEDSAGNVLLGDAIGAWDEVAAASAAFVSMGSGVRFSVSQVPGARLFRGRELDDERLAWAGFGYSCPRGMPAFSCEIRVERAQAAVPRLPLRNELQARREERTRREPYAGHDPQGARHQEAWRVRRARRGTTDSPEPQAGGEADQVGA